MKKLFLLGLAALTALIFTACKQDQQEAVTGISLYFPPSRVFLGKESHLDLKWTPQSAVRPIVEWTSSDPKVATVDANGVVKGVGVGEAVIEARTTTNLITSCSVVVIGPNSDGVIQITEAGTLEDILRNLDLFNTDKLALSGTIDDTDIRTIRTKLLVLEHLDLSATTLTSIGECAFSSCSSLTSVAIPNSVTSIGELAFSSCTSLASIILPNSVTSIGGSAFFNCSSLTSVTIPNSVTSIGEDAFQYCSSLTSIILPNSVTSIGKSVFSSCSSLTSVAIPNSVTSIGESAFSSCTSLASIILPNSVTSIGECAFSSCTSLASVAILTSVTSIGECAFSSCTSLTSVSIPYSVTSIGYGAFNSCDKLKIVACWATIPPTLDGDIVSYNNSAVLKVPAESLQSYKNHQSWAGSFNIIESL